MIGFFRRIRKKLADDNQFLKYSRYAVGEVLLVVVGILIALQVSNWNEQRKMNSQEQELLEGLEVEFTTNFNRLERVLELHQYSIECANEIMTYFNKDISDIPEAKFDSLLFHIQNVWTFNPRKGLLNSVITSGQINLISNVELKTHLASFEDMVNDIEEETREMSLLGAKFYSITNEYINIGKQNALGYKVFVNEGFKSDYNRFFKDFRAYNNINNEISWSYDLLDEEIGIMKSIERIIELITGELNK